jgi:hypothetical protein
MNRFFSLIYRKRVYIKREHFPVIYRDVLVYEYSLFSLLVKTKVIALKTQSKNQIFYVKE